MDILYFNSVFSPIGFIVESNTNLETVAHADGKDFGVYLSVMADVFSVELVYHHTQSFLFKFQHYSSLEDIFNLLQANHILSEQLFEKFGLSVHT